MFNFVIEQNSKKMTLKSRHTTTFNALHNDKAGFSCNTITSRANKPTAFPYYCYARAMRYKVFADESKSIYHNIWFLCKTNLDKRRPASFAGQNLSLSSL